MRSQRQLQGFADGSVRGKERDVVAEHLRSCASCRTELEDLAALRAALAALPGPAVPRSFAITPALAAEASRGAVATGGAPAPAPAPLRPPPPVAALRFARVTAAVAALGFGLLLAVDLAGVGEGGEETTTLASKEAAAGIASSASIAAASGGQPGAAWSATADPRGYTETPFVPPPYDAGGVSGQSAPPVQTPTPKVPATGPVDIPGMPAIGDAQTPTPAVPATGSDPLPRPTSLMPPGDQRLAGEDTPGPAAPVSAPAPAMPVAGGGATPVLRAFEAVFALVAVASLSLALFAGGAVRRAR